VPGVEEQINSRPGVSGHGGQKAKNPHAVAVEGAPAAPIAPVAPAAPIVPVASGAPATPASP
jgi:hypothetical protein